MMGDNRHISEDSRFWGICTRRSYCWWSIFYLVISW